MSRWSGGEDPGDEVRLGLRVIGEEIRAARLRLGMSQEQVAWRALVCQSTISKLETGKLQGMRLRTLARIVGVTRVPADAVLADMPPSPTRRLPGQKAA